MTTLVEEKQQEIVDVEIKDSSSLKFQAEVFDSVQKLRVATQNRARSLMQSGDDSGDYEAPVNALTVLEEATRKLMMKELKVFSPAIYQWVKDTPGLGTSTVARLVGEIGNPAIGIPLDVEKNPVGEPFFRKVSQLWAYCGHGDASKRPNSKGIDQAGIKAAGDPMAKMLVHLIAENTMKNVGGITKDGKNRQRSPYRDTYDLAREKYAEAIHTSECKRCGPSGKPAPVGSPLSDGHKHARALRKVGKEILKDMWLVAREEFVTDAE